MLKSFLKIAISPSALQVEKNGLDAKKNPHLPSSSPLSDVLPASTAHKVQSIIQVLKVNQLFPIR